MSKIHIHVGHDVLQRDFVEDWLDYVVAVSRVVRAPGVFVLSSTFPAKEKSDAEKADIVRAELEQFVAEHGQMPSQHADLISSRSLYAKLKKLKLLHLLKHDWRRGVCDDTLKFFDLHGRIPRRQNMTTDEQRAEDALAQRWDRLPGAESVTSQ